MSVQKTCISPSCQKPFKIIDQEQDFCEHKQLSLPEECPRCRHQKRMALRNERNLYARMCNKCQSKMMSTIPTTAPYTVYCNKCYWENIG